MDISSYTVSPWIKGSELPDEPQRVTIDGVRWHVFEQTKEKKLVVSFAEVEDQEMPLNKTQARTLQKFFGSDADHWIGKAITIWPAESSFAGQPTIVIGKAQQATAPTINGQQADEDAPF